MASISIGRRLWGCQRNSLLHEDEEYTDEATCFCTSQASPIGFCITDVFPVAPLTCGTGETFWATFFYLFSSVSHCPSVYRVWDSGTRRTTIVSRCNCLIYLYFFSGTKSWISNGCPSRSWSARACTNVWNLSEYTAGGGYATNSRIRHLPSAFAQRVSGLHPSVSRRLTCARPLPCVLLDRVDGSLFAFGHRIRAFR